MHHFLFQVLPLFRPNTFIIIFSLLIVPAKRNEFSLMEARRSRSIQVAKCKMNIARYGSVDSKNTENKVHKEGVHISLQFYKTKTSGYFIPKTYHEICML